MSLFLPPTGYKEYSVVDPIQSELSEDIIENNQIKPDIKNKILKKCKEIELHFKKKIKKIYIVGSSLTYQHTPTCDIDVTIFIQSSKEELKILNKQLSKNFNDVIFVNKHPIHFTFSTGYYDPFKADAIYDLINDKWIKKPSPLSNEDIQQMIEKCKNLGEFREILEEYTSLKDLLESYDGTRKNLDEILVQSFKVNHLFQKIKDDRREDFDKPKDSDIPSANYRCSNIIFKLLEQYGLNDLSSIIIDAISR